MGVHIFDGEDFISFCFQEVEDFLTSILENKEKVDLNDDPKFWLGLVLFTSSLAHFAMKACQRSPNAMGFTALHAQGSLTGEGEKDADPDTGGSEGAKITRMTMFFGVNLTFLSIMQCTAAGMGMKYVFCAVGVFEVVTAPIRASKRVAWSRGRDEGGITAHSIYHQFPGTMTDKLARFFGQALMIVFYLQNLGKCWDSSAKCYVFWLVTWFGVQVTSDRNASQVGKPWNGPLWREIISKNTAVSCLLDFVINGFGRDMLRFTLPLFMMMAETPLDFTKDALAVVFITTLDDIEAQPVVQRQVEDAAVAPGLAHSPSLLGELELVRAPGR